MMRSSKLDHIQPCLDYFLEHFLYTGTIHFNAEQIIPIHGTKLHTEGTKIYTSGTKWCCSDSLHSSYKMYCFVIFHPRNFCSACINFCSACKKICSTTRALWYCYVVFLPCNFCSACANFCSVCIKVGSTTKIFVPWYCPLHPSVQLLFRMYIFFVPFM